MHNYTLPPWRRWQCCVVKMFEKLWQLLFLTFRFIDYRRRDPEGPVRCLLCRMSPAVIVETVSSRERSATLDLMKLLLWQWNTTRFLCRLACGHSTPAPAQRPLRELHSHQVTTYGRRHVGDRRSDRWQPAFFCLSFTCLLLIRFYVFKGFFMYYDCNSVCATCMYYIDFISQHRNTHTHSKKN